MGYGQHYGRRVDPNDMEARPAPSPAGEDQEEEGTEKGKHAHRSVCVSEKIGTTKRRKTSEGVAGQVAKRIRV